MFREFFRFELRYQLRSPLLWIIAVAFMLLAWGAVVSDSIQIIGPIGNVHRNAPSVIIQFMAVFTILGLLAAVAFIALPVLRDFDIGTDELFFSSPMSKAGYLWGRVAAGLVATAIVYALIAVTIMAASFQVDAEQRGPFSVLPYLWAFGVLVLPDIVFIAALVSLLAITTRRLLVVFVGAFVFLVLWNISGALMRDIRFDTIVSLMDPFGIRTISRFMRYWSVDERNTLLPGITGRLLMNRVLWLGISALLIVAAQALFRPQRLRAKGRAKQRKRRTEDPAGLAIARTVLPVQRAAAPLPSPVFDAKTHSRQLLRQLRFDVVGVLRGIPFIVLLGFGLFSLLSGARTIESGFGTPVYPVTALMLETIQSNYQFLVILIVVFYAGEVIWKERDAKVAPVTDAMPVPDWVPLLAKIGALLVVVLICLGIGAIASMLYQLSREYYSVQPGLYLRSSLVDAVAITLMAVLGVVFQVVTNQKYVSYLLVILVMISTLALPGMQFEHNLYLYTTSLTMTYSDMNGFGSLLKPWAWFQTYWTLFAAMLAIVALAFWVRGTTPPWSERWRTAARSLRGPRGALFGAFAAAFIGVGAWIYYNTNILNEYLPADAMMDRQARYERDYRKYKDAPQPRIVDVRADVEIYPQERRAVIRGHYRLVNKHDAPIAELYVFMNPLAHLDVASLRDATLKLDDPQTGFRIYTLREPLAAGAAMDFDFTVERAERGFINKGIAPTTGAGMFPSPLNENGTFFNSIDMMPHLGYSTDLQIIDRNERRRRGLGEVPRMAKLEDESARGSLGFPDADWIDFETTVSTSADQVALAPGYLQREWTQNGRRYFHYKMDRPMMPFYCWLSARWAVKRGEWHGLPIEVYYDPKHPYNVDRMIEATQKSLDYFTENFSPYQYRQVRILEFPRYARFAQSFANTIPYSEALGFVADVRDPDNIDYPFYVTAHEMAHQWWAHQVIGADVQGSTMIVESLAQYSALMVMEKRYGAEHMRRFLKYELDRYLRGRGGELIEELPLMRVENQDYVHYSKGSLVFYRLRDEIGEDNLNRALANFIRDKAYQPPPYTTTRELLDYIRAQSQPDKLQLIEELFAKIVFYDDRIVAARSVKRPDGKYDVTIDYSAAKRESNGQGRETPLALDDWMEVGVFARGADASTDKEKQLYLHREYITRPTGTFKVVVDAEPFEVGIDPYNKLIDRQPDDNRKRLD
jgi:ABC-type transport system involved in multi-copper enzyme maturation permease subunit